MSTTGQSKKFNTELGNIKGTRFQPLSTGILNATQKVAALTLGVGMLTSLLGGREYENTANSLMQWGLVISAIIPVIGGLITFVRNLGMASVMAGLKMAASFLPILAVIGAIYGLYKVIQYLFDDEKAPSGALPSGTEQAAKAAKVQGGAPKEVATLMSKVPGGASLSQDFSGSTLSPKTSAMTPTVRTTDFGGQPVAVAPSKRQVTNYNKFKVFINATDPVEAGKEFEKKAKDIFSGEDAIGFG